MKKIMQERYSCREFNNQKINQETINEILDLTRLSPSSCGLEPWKFMVVSKENDLKEIHAIHAIAEDFAKNNREKYDYAVARAVAQLNTLV